MTCLKLALSNTKITTFLMMLVQYETLSIDIDDLLPERYDFSFHFLIFIM